MTVPVRHALPTLVAPSDVWTEETSGDQITTDGDVARLYDGRLTTGVTKPATFQAGHDMSAELELAAAGDITPAMPAGYRARAVRLFLSVRQFAYAWSGGVVAATGSVNGVDLPPISRFLAGLTYRDVLVTGDWLLDDDGDEWDASNLTDLAMALQMSNADGSFTYPSYAILIAEAGIEVDTVQPPTVVGLAPSSGYVDDSTLLSWVLEGNDPQTAYELKVWTAAVHGGLGFDPDTSPAVIDRVGTGSSSTNAFATATLPRGQNYFWSVRAAKDFHGTPWWSPWPAAVEVTYNDRPVVVVTGPASPVTDSSRPLVEFTSTDDQYGIAQAGWEARLYREPLAGWPTDVIGSPSLVPYTTGGANDGAKEWRPPRQLEAGTYRAYVRVRGITSPTSSGLWSEWAYHEFDDTTPADPGPDFTAAFDGPRVHLTLTTVAGDPADFVYVITRSLDGGDTWLPFPLWGLDIDGNPHPLPDSSRIAIPYPAGTEVDFYDYDLLMNRPLMYRATAIDISAGYDVATDPTVVGPITFASGRVLYLADPLVFAPPLELSIPDEWLTGNVDVPTGVFKPIGSDVFVVQRGQPGGATFSVNFQFSNPGDYDAALELLLRGTTLQLLTERRNWFVRLAASPGWQDHLTDSKYCTPRDVVKLSVPFAEVADPR